MKSKSNVKILGIIGSPRRGGNTEVLVDEILKGAKEANAEIDKVILNELKINPCQACNECKNGDCVQNDDMKILERKMRDSQVWIFGTPIYWWGPSAQFKLFLDRWYGFKKEIFENKKIILAITLGASSIYYARHTIGMFEDIIPYLSATLVETIIATGCGGKGSIRRKVDILGKAKDNGRNVVESFVK